MASRSFLRHARLTAALSLALALPPLVGAGVFLSVARTPLRLDVAGPPSALDPSHCTWYCHNPGCPHTPLLPPFLSGDQGAFGLTVQALQVGGLVTGLGYQGFNILVYCVVWPGVTGLLYGIAVGRYLWKRW